MVLFSVFGSVYFQNPMQKNIVFLFFYKPQSKFIRLETNEKKATDVWSLLVWDENSKEISFLTEQFNQFTNLFRMNRLRCDYFRFLSTINHDFM